MSDDNAGIEALVYEYASALDSRNAEAFARCFAPQGRLLGPGLNFETEVVRDFAPRLMDNFGRWARTMHNVQNRLYAIDGDRANGVTYCIASHVGNIGKDGALAKLDLYMQYHDELMREEDRWVFVCREYELLFSTTAEVELLGEDKRSTS